MKFRAVYIVIPAACISAYVIQYYWFLAIQGSTFPNIFATWQPLKNVELLDDKLVESRISTNLSTNTEEIIVNINHTKLIQEISEERRHHLEEVCIKRGLKFSQHNLSHYLKMAPRARPRFFFSDKYKILICEVPKCGSTEWRNALLLLENDVNPQELNYKNEFDLAMKHRFLWNRFPGKDAKSVQELQHRLDTYYRVMTVREPLERVVSAYIDKLSKNTSKLGEYYIQISKQIHQQNGGTDGDIASWEEFVENMITSKKYNTDIHWQPFDTICDPCNIQYDYIAKLETIVEDSNYIAKKIGIDENPFFTGEIKTDLQHKWKEKYSKYYERLPKEKVEKLYNIYKGQYELFGYPKPPFVNESTITR